MSQRHDAPTAIFRLEPRCRTPGSRERNRNRVPVVHPRRSWVLRGCSDAIDHAAGMGPDGTLWRHQSGRNSRVLDWRAPVGPDSTKRSGLLIRGFGVRVPGGAQKIKALAWYCSPDQSPIHVHHGQLCARRVLCSQRIRRAPCGLDGQSAVVIANSVVIKPRWRLRVSRQPGAGGPRRCGRRVRRRRSSAATMGFRGDRVALARCDASRVRKVP
jgi:hypothetical protein